MGGGRLSLLALALGAAAWAGEADIVVDAERMVLDSDGVRAEGEVTVSLAGQDVTGELVGLVEGGSAVVVRHGQLARDDLGLVSFDAARLDLASGRLTLTGAHLTGSDGTLRAAADVLIFEPDGAVLADGLQVTTCACSEPTPWVVRAAHATLLDDVVRFRGAVVDVAGVPLLPLPFGEVPLVRRSGLLPPTLATGINGFQASLPVYVVLGRSADMTLAPEVLTARGVRLLGEGRWATAGGTGEVDVSGAWDTVLSAPRGGATWQHAAHRGRTSLATTGQLVSDLPYLADYGDGFLSRRQPWGEVRAVLGWGGVELTSNVFQAPDVATQQLGGLALYRPAVDVGGGVLAAATVRSALLATAPDPWSVDGAWGVGEAAVSVTRPTWVGPVRATPELAAGGVADTEVELGGGGWTTAGGEVALPLWKPHPRSREHIELAVRGALSEGLGDAELAPAAWTLAPAATYRVTGTRISFEARGAMVGGPDGWRPAIDAQGGTDGLRGWVQADGVADPWAAEGPGQALDLASTGLRGEVRSFKLEGGWLYARPEAIRQPDPDADHALHQLRASTRVGLPGALATVWVSGGASYDLDGVGFVTRRVGLGWRHPTGCMALAALGELNVDRPLPDVALKLTVNGG